MNHQLQNHKNTVGSLASAIDVGAMLAQLHDIVHDAVAEKQEAGTDGRSWLINSYSEIDRETMRIYELIKKKRAENEALLNVPTDEEELKKFIVHMEAGAEAVRNSTKVHDWTEELKSEYTNRFLELNKSLDGIYHRLNAMHPLKWKAGKFGQCGTPSSNGFANINNTVKDSVFTNDRQRRK